MKYNAQIKFSYSTPSWGGVIGSTALGADTGKKSDSGFFMWPIFWFCMFS